MDETDGCTIMCVRREEVLATRDQTQRSHLILQVAVILHRRFGVFPPVCVFMKPCPTLSKTARGVWIVDQACAEEIDAVLQILGSGNEV